MEIRNALQKIENYLTVVSNLNKTILAEGAMSREELLLMKKYLNSCIDRITDIERKLSINMIETPPVETTTVLTNTTEIVEADKNKEIVAVDENQHIEEMEATLNTEQQQELEMALDEIEQQIEKQEEAKTETLFTVVEEEVVATPELKTEETNITPVAELVTNETENKLMEESTKEEVIAEVIQAAVENEIKKEEIQEQKEEEQTSVADHIYNSITQTIDELKNKAEEIKNSEFVQNAETKLENFAAVTQQKMEAMVDDFKKEEDKIEKDKESLVAKMEDRKKQETSFFEKLEDKFKEDNSKPLFHLFDDGKEDFHETLLNKKQEDTKLFTLEKNEVKDEPVVETKSETIQNTESLNDIFKTNTVTHVETIQQPKVRKSLQELIMLNDKFVFVRELFGNQFAEYDTAIKSLENMNSLNDAENYCRNQLWTKFNWNDKVAYQMRFFDVLQKRFG
ncbi:MAG TPA: hypothetical protein PKO18_06660 [Chitinophagales bacterium]|nr:hypothetical protein [Chitinophagales bacterium]HNL84900.1 hypothetical protein [Chitinophagales bacterium]HNO71829.1 hypothetical protein [Bacteroidia bacterium]